jgi:CheY-like chemotaxis protein
MAWNRQKKSLTTGDIAEVCGVNFRTVIRWIQAGLLKAYQLPSGRGDNRVQVRDFLEFLHANKMPVPDALRAVSNRVLVVEDEEEMALAMRRVLERKGFEVMIAQEGFLAGCLAMTFAPAVMTLDLRMPGLGGLEVLKGIRNDPELADTRVLVVSAMPQGQLDEALQAGADDILVKPFRNQDLVDKVTALASAG